METFSALLAICAGNSPATGEFPTQRRVTRSYDVFLDLHPNERLSKQWWGWWFEMPSCPLWRHCNVMHIFRVLLCMVVVWKIEYIPRIVYIYTVLLCVAVVWHRSSSPIPFRISLLEAIMKEMGKWITWISDVNEITTTKQSKAIVYINLI